MPYPLHALRHQSQLYNGALHTKTRPSLTSGNTTPVSGCGSANTARPDREKRHPEWCYFVLGLCSLPVLGLLCTTNAGIASNVLQFYTSRLSLPSVPAFDNGGCVSTCPIEQIFLFPSVNLGHWPYTKQSPTHDVTKQQVHSRLYEITQR